MKIKNKIIFIIVIILLIGAIGIKIFSETNFKINENNNEEKIIYENKISNINNNDTQNNIKLNTLNNSQNNEVIIENIINITNENFNEKVLNSNKIVILDFGAVWCAPCTYMSAVLDDIAKENPEIIIGKVNVDEETELANNYAITAIPTIFIYKNGKVEEKIIGIVDKEKINDYIKKLNKE